MHAVVTPHHSRMRRLLPALAVAALPAVALAQHERHGAQPPSQQAALLEGMGSHQHPITTSNKLAQRYFDQGLSLAYAFNHPEAKRSFLEATRLDPSCAMCYWGVAFVLGPNINAPMDTAANAEAYQATQRALELAKNATARERAYIDALARRYAATAPSNRAPLDSAFARAMRDVARRYPSDADAATLFAEAMMDLTPWVYWTADRKPLPGTAELLAALERVIRKNPNHPGACHLYIHAVEAAFPQRAVACAERLAALMPGAGHIVHMPAHIYLRVGRYNDAIKANEHAVHADETYIADQRVQSSYTAGYYPHNYHFLAFAATMAGRRAKAVEAARGAAAKVPLDIARDVPDLQPIVAYPQLTLATFGRWEDISREPLPRADLRVATGLAWYARGVAAAGQQRWDDAQAALDSVKSISASITQYPGGPVLRIATHALAGEVDARRGKLDAAIHHLNSAMAIEDSLTYMEPPYWHQPVRHLLGAALLKAGRASRAEALYRQDLGRFPENVWSLRGLEQSLVAQRRHAEAARVRQRLQRAAQEADVALRPPRF